MPRCHINPNLASTHASSQLKGLSWPAAFAQLDQRNRNLSHLQPVHFTPPLHSCPLTTPVTTSSIICFIFFVSFALKSFGGKTFACGYLMCRIVAEVILFSVNYSTVDWNVLPLWSRKVKFSVLWACQGYEPHKSSIVQSGEQTHPAKLMHHRHRVVTIMVGFSRVKYIYCCETSWLDLPTNDLKIFKSFVNITY